MWTTWCLRFPAPSSLKSENQLFFLECSSFVQHDFLEHVHFRCRGLIGDLIQFSEVSSHTFTVTVWPLWCTGRSARTRRVPCPGQGQHEERSCCQHDFAPETFWSQLFRGRPSATNGFSIAFRWCLVAAFETSYSMDSTSPIYWKILCHLGVVGILRGGKTAWKGLH